MSLTPVKRQAQVPITTSAYWEVQDNSWEGEPSWDLGQLDIDQRVKSKLCTIRESPIYISGYSLIWEWVSEEN